MPEHRLEGFPLVIRRHVKWGEMDAFQHVNNTVYFRWFEDARIAHFETLGVLEIMEERRRGPILASTAARFRRPLDYPDEVLVGSRIGALEEDRFVMEYAVKSVAQDALAATGEGLVVYFDYAAGRKCAVPEPLRTRIEAETGG